MFSKFYVKKWHKMFNDSQEEVVEEAKSGDNFKVICHCLSFKRVYQIVETVNLSKLTVRCIHIKVLKLLPASKTKSKVRKSYIIVKNVFNLIKLRLNPVVFYQPSYSSDLTSADIFSLSRLKETVKGEHLESITNIYARVTQALRDPGGDISGYLSGMEITFTKVYQCKRKLLWRVFIYK